MIEVYLSSSIIFPIFYTYIKSKTSLSGKKLDKTPVRQRSAALPSAYGIAFLNRPRPMAFQNERSLIMITLRATKRDLNMTVRSSP